VWPLLVEVADVDAEDVLELAATEDQEAIEAIPTYAAHPAFRVGIRVRRADRCAEDRDVFALEDATLRVPIETKNSTYNRRSQTVSTAKKSQASREFKPCSRCSRSGRCAQSRCWCNWRITKATGAYAASWAETRT
jgi:hypothetical protein